MSIDDSFPSIPSILESQFPSPLHYRIAIEFEKAFHNGHSQEVSAIDKKYSSLNLEALVDFWERFTKVMDTLQLSSLSDMPTYSSLIELLEMKRKDIEGGSDTPVIKQGQIVPESSEVRLEGINRALSLLRNIEQFMVYHSEIENLSINGGTLLANYTMINAESQQEQVAVNAIRNKAFRDQVIRLAFPNYEAAVRYFCRQDEFVRQLSNVVYGLIEFISKAPRIWQRFSTLALPGRKEVDAYINDGFQLHQKEFRLIYSSPTSSTNFS